MGYKNHELFIRQHKEKFRGPFLEIGAKDYGSTVNLRAIFPGETYVGIDMEDGNGVDLVFDLTRPFDEIDKALAGRRFGSVFCLSVMEHCAQPFLMASNITQLLMPGGCLYISVPYAWKFHGYPSDYWRFTHEGVKKLFPDLAFDMTSARASTDVIGDFHPIDEDLCRMRISGGWQRKRGRTLRGIGASLLALLGKGGLFSWLTRHRYLMPPTCIEMIGVRVPKS
jgi:SAM-dependent methyltransferase